MQAWKGMAGAALALALAALAGCSASPAVRYYTLLPGLDAGPDAAPAARAEGGAVQVLPVSLPAELDTTQMLVRTGPGEVVPFNGERWTGYLSDQIQASLSATLSRRMGLPAVQSDVPGVAVWRAHVNVQRFESTPQGQAGMEAVWRLRKPGSQAEPPLCYSRFSRTADTAGVAGLVQAHQANIDALAADMAAAAASGGCGTAAARR